MDAMFSTTSCYWKRYGLPPIRRGVVFQRKIISLVYLNLYYYFILFYFLFLLNWKIILFCAFAQLTVFIFVKINKKEVGKMKKER